MNAPLVPVPARSARADGELRSRVGRLSARQRQILILCDGRRSVDALRRYFPEPGFGDEIANLVETGFLIPRGAPQPDEPGLDERRERLSRACANLLGDVADPFVERIGRAGSRAELRRLVPAILATIAAVRGAESVRAFQQQVDPL